jgi:hypothetical protein
VSVQDRCMVCANRTTPPMVRLGDEAQVEDRFSPFRDSAILDARWMHGLRQTYHRPINCFGST